MRRRRLLPAHVVVFSAAVGLAATNAVRLHGLGATALAAAAVLAVGAVLPLPPHLAGLAVGGCLLGLAWGTVRLDSLDRSPLLAEVDRGGRAVVEVTGEARSGMFSLKIPGRIRRFDGRPVGERVQLELPLGRAPPQGALLDALVVVRLPRGPSHGFDERRWLRRQGVHVVLKVDSWRVIGRRRGLGGLADRLRAWLERDADPGLGGSRRAVVAGVVLGDGAALSPSLQTSFRRSGLYHLLSEISIGHNMGRTGLKASFTPRTGVWGRCYIRDHELRRLECRRSLRRPRHVFLWREPKHSAGHGRRCSRKGSGGAPARRLVVSGPW